MAYFPMFVDITDKECLVIGGGRVALRKVQVLLDFDASVVVVARKIAAEIKEIASPRLVLMEREFNENDIDGKTLVVVATDDNSFNHRISQLCNDKSIPVNVVDDKENCSFIFPSYVKEKNLVGAFSSSGNSPVLAKYLKDKITDHLTPELGELNDLLGKWRPKVIESVKDEKDKKAIFERIVDEYFSSGKIPTDDVIMSILQK